VAFQRETVVLGDLLLALFDVRIRELDYRAAIRADQVIVVVAIVQFEDGLAAVELAASQDACRSGRGRHLRR
jgi:hypothetical protein